MSPPCTTGRPRRRRARSRSGSRSRARRRTSSPGCARAGRRRDPVAVTNGAGSALAARRRRRAGARRGRGALDRGDQDLHRDAGRRSRCWPAPRRRAGPDRAARGHRRRRGGGAAPAGGRARRWPGFSAASGCTSSPAASSWRPPRGRAEADRGRLPRGQGDVGDRDGPRPGRGAGARVPLWAVAAPTPRWRRSPRPPPRPRGGRAGDRDGPAAARSRARRGRSRRRASRPRAAGGAPPAPLLSVLPGELAGPALALAKGLDPGAPRHLRKVTRRPERDPLKTGVGADHRARVLDRPASHRAPRPRAGLARVPRGWGAAAQPALPVRGAAARQRRADEPARPCPRRRDRRQDAAAAPARDALAVVVLRRRLPAVLVRRPVHVRLPAARRRRALPVDRRPG